MVISHRKDGATDDFWADMLKFLVHEFFLIFTWICGGDLINPRKFHLYMWIVFWSHIYKFLKSEIGFGIFKACSSKQFRFEMHSM